MAYPALSNLTGLMSIAFSEIRDVQTAYGYPNDCGVVEFNWPVYGTSGVPYKFHIIVYNGAPAALFNNAPKGSLFIDLSTPKFMMKTAEVGTGTWVGAAAS